MTPNLSTAQLQLQHEFQSNKLGHWKTLPSKLKSSISFARREREGGKQVDVKKKRLLLVPLFQLRCR